MGQQVAERPAPGLLPGQHAFKVFTVQFARHVAIGVGIGVGDRLVPVGVKGIVKFLHLFGRKEVLYLEKALQVVHEFLAFIHPIRS